MSGRRAMLPAVSGLIAALAVTSPVATQPSTPAACARCAWSPPASNTTISVRNAGQLFDAVARARPDTTILLEDGRYRLDRMLDIATPRVVVRGKSGDRARVVVHGGGMSDRRAGVALSISAPDVTVADLTIRDVGYHGIQVRGEHGAARVMIHNVHVIDTGQQLIKGSTAGDAFSADDGTVACSTLEYSDTAPSDYTQGIDVLAAGGWTVRDNVFRNIRGPATRGYAAGPAILFWVGSHDTQVERNVIIDSFRGIAFGLAPREGQAGGSHDHRGGAIRNNVVVNLHPWADEGIEANAAAGVQIDHNTVVSEGRLSWAISVRFPETSGWVRNNLSNRPVIFRDGGRAQTAGNVSGAARHWFADLAAADVRLAATAAAAVDAGIEIPEIAFDAARSTRTIGRAPDAGAFEYRGATP